MKYFEKKHVHSYFASFSTSDLFPVREITYTEYKRATGEKTLSTEHGFGVWYSPSDETYGGVEYLRNAPSKEVVEAYVKTTYLDNGYVLDHKYLTPRLKQHWADESAARIARRIKQGYVIPEWSADLPVESYQGGFSDETFTDPYLQKYLQGGGCHGYIGHAARRPQTDAYLEKQWFKHNDDRSLLAMWLTSSDGRHFADWEESGTLADQKAYIKEKIQRCIETANRYRREEAVNV